MKRYDYIDGLRGLAIAGVVLIHLGQYYDNLPAAAANFAAYGLRGVTLFFIVSAFTLSLAYYGRTFDPVSFYIKRFFRIAPMFYLAIVVYFSLYSFGHSEFAGKDIGGFDVVMTFLLMHGLSPHAINTVVPGGWSIASEFLFYLTFPFLMVYAHSLKRAFVLLVLSFLLVVVSRPLIAYALQGHYPPDEITEFVYFGFLNNLPAFVMGMFLYHLVNCEAVKAHMPRYANALLYAALLALVVIGLSGKLKQPVLAVPFLGMVLLASHFSTSKLLDNPLMRHLGVVSFSVYLIHFLVLWGLFSAAPGLVSAPIYAPLAYLVALFLSAVVATVTYRAIEKPFINVANMLSKLRLTSSK